MIHLSVGTSHDVMINKLEDNWILGSGEDIQVDPPISKDP